MSRTLALIAFLNHFAWGTGVHPSGSRMIWAGTMVRFGWGPHVALEWDELGVAWSASWCDAQDEADEFEAGGWYAEGRVGGETRVVTP